MKNNKLEESFKLYNEELTYCLKRGASIRKVSLMATIIEAQVTWLGKGLMESKNFKYKPSETYEFSFYSDVLKNNLSFYEGFWAVFGDFRKERNFILHNVFKAKVHSRDDLDNSINLAAEKGAEIIRHLDERLMLLGTSENS